MKNNPTRLLLGALLGLVTLNLSWEHQSLLIPQLTTTDYYHFEAREPFIYRILPALLYRSLTGTRPDVSTGLNAPVDSLADIFQLLLDTASLCVTFIFLEKIIRRFNPRLPPAVTRTVAAAAGLMIVIFGFFMVPNRAFFYPYDFPDLCLATVIFYLCIRLQGAWEYLLPVTIFVATLNKETAVYYSGLYLALRASPGARWGHIAAVLGLCAAAFIAARLTVSRLVHQLHSDTLGHQQYELHLLYTLQQLINPLFMFSMLNICSYLYVAIYVLRKKLDRTDGFILLMIGGWVLIMSTVGIIRELRIFVPASLMMFVIIARHLDEAAIEIFRLRSHRIPG
jgi:hypothetical protein